MHQCEAFLVFYTYYKIQYDHEQRNKVKQTDKFNKKKYTNEMK